MVFYHLIMQMIPGTYPGASHEPDHVPLFHLRTFKAVCRVLGRDYGESGCLPPEDLPPLIEKLSDEIEREKAWIAEQAAKREKLEREGRGGIHRRHIQACVKLPFTAYRMRPVAVTVGDPVFLFQGCDRGDETVNIPVLLDDPPHRGDVPVIPCGLQHLHDQRTFVLRPHPADRDQRKDRKAKYPPHSRCRCSPGQKERDGLRSSR